MFIIEVVRVEVKGRASGGWQFMHLGAFSELLL